VVCAEGLGDFELTRCGRGGDDGCAKGLGHWPSVLAAEL
jgi:hypothetical protein